MKLGNYIKKNYPNVKIIYTRKDDTFIELIERSEIANRNNADLFISIHVNASTRKEAYGTSTYVMGLNSTDKNMAVAKRENSVISIEIDTAKYKGFNTDTPENNIILQLRQNSNINQSILLASKVQNQFKRYAKRKDRGVYQAGLIVLYNVAMPGVLIETGFISNTKEEKWLNTSAGQNTIASAIYRAFKQYKNEVEAKSTGNFSFEKNNTKKEIQKKEIIKIPKKENENMIVYKIQFKTSPKKLNINSSEFKSLKKVNFYYQAPIYKYTCGETINYKEALQTLKTVKVKYKDAFIVKFKNGKRI